MGDRLGWDFLALLPCTPPADLSRSAAELPIPPSLRRVEHQPSYGRDRNSEDDDQQCQLWRDESEQDRPDDDTGSTHFTCDVI